MKERMYIFFNRHFDMVAWTDSKDKAKLYRIQYPDLTLVKRKVDDVIIDLADMHKLEYRLIEIDGIITTNKEMNMLYNITIGDLFDILEYPKTPSEEDTTGRIQAFLFLRNISDKWQTIFASKIVDHSILVDTDRMSYIIKDSNRLKNIDILDSRERRHYINEDK